MFKNETYNAPHDEETQHGQTGETASDTTYDYSSVDGAWRASSRRSCGYDGSGTDHDFSL